MFHYFLTSYNVLFIAKIYSLNIGLFQNFIYYPIVDCCKQFINWLYHPPTHSPIHPSTHTSSAILFGTKKERMPIYCIQLLLLCANYKTGEDRFFTPVFEHKCSKFSTSFFTTQMWKIYNFKLYHFNMTFSTFWNKHFC